jgi:hypothetical protein
MVKFIRIEQVDDYLAQGWVIIKCGTEMAAVRRD